VRSGWDEAGGSAGFKRFIRDKEEAQDLIDETRLVRTVEDWQRAVDRVQRDLAEEPNSKKLLLQLGDTYRLGAAYADYREVYPKALECYRKAQAIDQADVTISERMEDIKIAELGHQIEELREKVKAGDASAKAKLDALETEYREFSLKSFEKRVKNRPTDAGLRWELAERYFAAGNFDEAVQQYQYSERNPKLRKQSLNRMGECMLKKGIYDLAIARFEDALKDVMLIGPIEKEILYNLGAAADAAGDSEKAEQAYKRIYETDIGFKDVAKKIEDIYRRRSSGSQKNPDAPKK